MNFIERDYVTEWCKRLITATETNDMRTVNEMMKSLQSPDDQHNPLRIVVNGNSVTSIHRIVEALRQVKDLDTHTAAQWFVLSNCAIKDMISTRNFDQQDIDIIEGMIQLGSPVNEAPGNRVFSALHCAICEGDSFLPLTKLLLDNGADLYSPDSDSLTPLNVCLEGSNCLEVLRLLVSRGIHFDTSALLTAIYHKQPREFIQLLMQANSDVRVRDDRGFVKVYDPERGLRSQECIDYLLDLGMDPNTRTIDGISILFFMIEEAPISYLRYLVLVCGVELNARIFLDRLLLLSIENHRRGKVLQQKYELEYESIAGMIRFFLLRGGDFNYLPDKAILSDAMLVLQASDAWLDLRVEQMVVREFMDLPVNGDVVNKVYGDKFWVSYIAACKLELVELMDMKLHGNVTLFNILTDSDAKMMSHMRNEELLAAFRKFCGMRLFLIYLPALTERIEHFLYLHGIREAAGKVLCNSVLGFTNFVIEQGITKYLSIRDLFNLSKFCSQ